MSILRSGKCTSTAIVDHPVFAGFQSFRLTAVLNTRTAHHPPPQANFRSIRPPTTRAGLPFLHDACIQTIPRTLRRPTKAAISAHHFSLVLTIPAHRFFLVLTISAHHFSLDLTISAHRFSLLLTVPGRNPISRLI